MTKVLLRWSVNWKRWGIILALLSLIWMWQQWPDGKLHVVFCDVGQGDGTLIVLGSFQALVDTGASETKLFACLGKNMPFWDRRIDLVFLSHSDNDHIGALGGLKKRYQIGKIIDKPKAGDIFRYGSLVFDILKGSEPVVDRVMAGGSASNEQSVIMEMFDDKFSVLFTGDIDISSELAMVEGGVLRPAQVLKVSHHGSKYGSSMEFLKAVRPALAIISVGVNNTYGRSSGDTLMRLEQVGAKILRTDKMGAVSVVSDGKEMKVFSER